MAADQQPLQSTFGLKQIGTANFYRLLVSNPCKDAPHPHDHAGDGDFRALPWERGLAASAPKK